MHNCKDCDRNRNKQCQMGMNFYSDDWNGCNHNCYLYVQRIPSKTKIKRFFKELFKLGVGLVVALIVVAVIFGVFCFDYCWTKRSLEDIAGKEVKPSTVIWTMLNSNKGRHK